MKNVDKESLTCGTAIFVYRFESGKIGTTGNIFCVPEYSVCAFWEILPCDECCYLSLYCQGRDLEKRECVQSFVHQQQF